MKPDRVQIAVRLSILTVLLVLTMGFASGAVVLNSSEGVNINVTHGNEVASFNETGLSLNDNNLYNYWDDACGTDRAVKGINDDGSLQCTDRILDETTESLNDTLVGGNIANMSIRMNGNDIDNPGNINNFFDSTCDSGEVIEGVNSDGSYICTPVDGETTDYWVNQSGDNMTGQLNMTGHNINLGGGFLSNDGDNEGLQILDSGNVQIPGGDLQIGPNNDITDLSGVRRLEINDGQTSLHTAAGDGSGVITMWDSQNNQVIADFNEGGNIDIQSGDLLMNQNDIQNAGYIDANGMNLSNSTSNTNIASFQDNLIQMHQPLSLDSGSGLNVDGGVTLTGSSSNTIESYSTMYLTTSSGSPSDIVLDPTGVVGVGSNLDMASNNIQNVNEIQDFFSNACNDPNEAVKQIHSDGTYTCETIPEDTGVEDLSSTLEAGNVANQSIDMDGNNLVLNGGYLSNDGDNEGIQIGNNGDVQVPNGDLTDGTNVIYSQSDSWVPLSILEASQFTVTSGDGLQNGGSAELGNSVTLDIEPADFAGSFLSDDGSDNLQVNTGTFISGDGSGNIDVDIANGLKDDGSGNIAVEPADFAGNALEDDGSDNLAVSSNGINTDELAVAAVTNDEIANNVVNRTQLDGSGCGSNQVLRSDGSNWICVSESNLGSEAQNLANVLETGNFADGTDIVMNGSANLNMDGNNIQNVDTVNPGGDTVNTGGSVNVGSGSVTSSQRMCIGDRCA